MRKNVSLCFENILRKQFDLELRCVCAYGFRTDRQKSEQITNKHVGVVMNDAFELLLHLLLSLLRIYRTREGLYTLVCWYLRMFADLMTWNGEYTCRIYTARMQLHLGSVWYPSHAISDVLFLLPVLNHVNVVYLVTQDILLVCIMYCSLSKH